MYLGVALSSLLLKTALKKYLKTVSILKKGYEQEKYRIDLMCRSFLGELRVKEVTSVHIATYRDNRLATINQKTKKNISPSTVRLEMSLLSNFFDIARIEWGYCESNPVSNVRKPKAPPGRDRRLTTREERLIYRYSHAHSNIDLYSIVCLGLETAMRQGEILSLRWEHINLKSRIAHLPETKNGTKRDVPLSVKARDALIRMGVSTKGPVFNYTSAGLKSTWRFMLIKLGISNLHFHDLRHEAISRFFELGTLDMMEISAISGHKSLSMLKRYTHLKMTRLVRKLEGNKNKGMQVVMDYLIPYPAVLDEHEHGMTLKLLDFEALEVAGQCHESTIKHARDALLRRIISMIKDSVSIPPPDQYLDLIDESKVIMIDPMAIELV
jgi:integrase